MKKNTLVHEFSFRINLNSYQNKLTYRFKVNNAYVQVCQQFFVKTVDISDKKVRIMMDKEKRSTSGSLLPDRRGHHEPVNKLSGEDVNRIRQHLSLLPKVPTHWCRRDSSKVYLERIKTKQAIYELYVAYAIENNFRQVSDTRYFGELEQLNIGFHQPRKDMCWCTRFDNISDEEKAEKQAEYDLHIRRKNAA
ncbi:Protein of unknown function [Cotesia congregata]|uniref:Uncharacterized protein n=1 Tax=Cotesia congregata TaxID=51543 RepID=A0A8J2END3_COTCN|nr:Protein of unknown function [Cotesia congregata]